jgi:hypothetical protein
MFTFINHLDARLHGAAPQVARIELTMRTYATDSIVATDTTVTKYICIGTEYNYIHTSSGDVRTWDSYSGARKFLVRYCEDHELALPVAAKGTWEKKVSK